MRCNKDEDSEVDYEEVDPKQMQQINKYQPLFIKGNRRKKIPTAISRCDIIIAVVLIALTFLISIVMLPLMAYEIWEIKSTFNGENHSKQCISELSHQLTSLMEQINNTKKLDVVSNQIISDIQELFEFDSCNFLQNFSRPYYPISLKKLRITKPKSTSRSSSKRFTEFCSTTFWNCNNFISHILEFTISRSKYGKLKRCQIAETNPLLQY